MVQIQERNPVFCTLILVLVTLLTACSAKPPAQTAAVPTANVARPVASAIPSLTPLPATVAPTPTLLPPPTRIAVIGDYGWAGDNEAGVAALVKSWNPDYIITTGDNNYPAGAAETIDANVGQYYHEFIGSYAGSYGQGAAENRFFPVLGNHDIQGANGQPYYDYFALPGNERYYSAGLGPVQMFALNSMPGEVDGVTPDGVQAAWLREQLGASKACWNVVVFHHPPFTSGHYGPSTWMQWPFAQWGADLILSGHDHSYERFAHDEIPYIVNGVGGGALYALGSPIEGSEFQFQGGYGAMLIEADTAKLHLQFITVDGTVVDDQTLTANC